MKIIEAIQLKTILPIDDSTEKNCFGVLSHIFATYNSENRSNEYQKQNYLIVLTAIKMKKFSAWVFIIWIFDRFSGIKLA